LPWAGIFPRFWIFAAAIAALLVVYFVAIVDAVKQAAKREGPHLFDN